MAAAAVAAIPMLWLRGFTVDDALITGRVAHQLATGNGYHFNPAGPATDAVTPFGWAWLLAPFARGGPLPAFVAAKWLGALGWSLAAGFCGSECARFGSRALAVCLLALLVTTPLAAWGVAGMETGVVMGLCTAALALGTTGRLAAGVAAALRPELAPWALTLLVADALLAPGSERERLARGARAAGWALGPFVAVAIARSAWFGTAYPLAVEAKPAALDAGIYYTLGALRLSGPPWLLTAPHLLGRASRRCRVIVLATLAHLLALVLVGGDWMPLFRLFVPVLPGVILAGAELASLASRRGTLIRALLLLASATLVAAQLGPAAARVGEQRRLLIEGARPWLVGARHPATVDIGWVGVATPENIVDLAGVTDPRVARLPGGHTTKRLPDGFLAARDVDALILLADAPRLSAWPELHFVRGVDYRVTTLAGAERFRPVALIPLLGTTQAYVIARLDPAAR